MFKLAFASALAALFCFSTISSVGACPQPEFITPCTCRPLGPGIYIVCEHVNDTATLRDIFQRLAVYDIQRLLLKGCHLNEGNAGSIFHGLKIHLLRFMDTTFAGQPSNSGTLSGLAARIRRLDTTNCGGQLSFPHLGMGPMRWLETLNVQKDNFSVLRREFMPDPSALKVIMLEQCGIRSLETGALEHISSLKSLTIKKNSLTVIHRNSLPNDCTELNSIDFSENQLSVLPPGFFDGMDNLHTVNLYNNRLQCLEESIWRPVWPRLERLWVNENPLFCNQSVTWIYNRLPAVLHGVCQNPENLKGMQLTEVTMDQLEP